ncbi:MAG TPA: hypothetical protein VGC01_02370 [Mucilaginibacter sp.]
MKTILVLNDGSHCAVNASKFAFFIAQKMQANVLLANLFKIRKKANQQIVAGGPDNHLLELTKDDLGEYLETLNNRPNDFQPEIKEIDTSAMNETQLIEIINKEDIWMVVKSIPNVLPLSQLKGNLNLNTVLNKIECPLMLIPQNWSLKNIERLVYITDLRYCRLPIVRYLAELAKPCHADLSIAHISANGMPDMDEAYADCIFNEGICTNVNYDQLLFNNIREKDLTKAVDVLINCMHNDILVMVKNCFHINEIVGKHIYSALPYHITVPLLVFPY